MTPIVGTPSPTPSAHEYCNEIEQKDETNDERVILCSTLNPCFDTVGQKYTKDLCSNENESCAYWTRYKEVGRDVTVNGCILTMYCGLEAKYL